jgi:hypothetical protein
MLIKLNNKQKKWETVLYKKIIEQLDYFSNNDESDKKVLAKKYAQRFLDLILWVDGGDFIEDDANPRFTGLFEYGVLCSYGLGIRIIVFRNMSYVFCYADSAVVGYKDSGFPDDPKNTTIYDLEEDI